MLHTCLHCFEETNTESAYCSELCQKADAETQNTRIRFNNWWYINRTIYDLSNDDLAQLLQLELPFPTR